MAYEIKRSPDFAVVDLRLAAGESIVAAAGAVIASSAGVAVRGAARGGPLAAAKRRLLGGESISQHTFTAEGGPGRVLIAPGAPGDVLALDLEAGRSLMIQSSAYLAATPAVRLDGKWDGARGFFADAGTLLLRATGPGTVFVCGCGAIIPACCDGALVVATDHVVAFPESVRYAVAEDGGGGLVAELTGQGTIHTQTRGPARLAAFLDPYRRVQNRS